MSATPTDFGTFSGVFRPITLTVLGAMLYLREGWLVGEAGLIGALLIIAAAAAITGTTAMSLASIASNVRVRPGGAFAIIAQALGLEAGGAIGVPLYIAQAASAAMYIYAFAESWALLFPDHPQQVVAGAAFVGVALLAWRSSGLALRAQGIMLVVVAAALVSALAGLGTIEQVETPQLFGSAPDASLVTLFAIFFPAFTGIMVGAGMSGSLADPRRAIPRGTLAAWAVTTMCYAGFALWYALIAPPDVLIDDRGGVIIERAAVPALVVAGLLCSTLMAALSSLVAAPRLLQAMARHRIVPAAGWLSAETPAGEPRNAVVATTALAAVGLAAGSLDAIAPIITSFFILTYLSINAVVYLELSLGMISFRPAFVIRRSVPLLGLGLCLIGLLVSSPLVGSVALLFVVAVYAVLSVRQLETPWETVRSGIAVSLAAWAARRASGIERSERAWKPDMLVPASTEAQVRDLQPLVEALAEQAGSIRWVGLGPRPEIQACLPAVVAEEAEDGLYSTWTHLRTERYMDGIGLALDALRGGLFPPNLVFVDERQVAESEIAGYLDHCRALSVGLALWQPHPRGRLGDQALIDIWLSDRSPDWHLELHLANIDLPVLIGYLLSKSWGARLRLRTLVRDPAQIPAGEAFLEALVEQARLPAGTSVHVGTGDFLTALREAADADLNLFGMPPTVDQARLRTLHAASGGSCLWLMDAGAASAIA